jgi:hypothetical protein
MAGYQHQQEHANHKYMAERQPQQHHEPKSHMEMDQKKHEIEHFKP